MLLTPMLGVSICQRRHSMVPMPPPAHAAMRYEDVEFEMLQQSYTEYSGALRGPCAEASKAHLANLSDQLHSKGVYGNNALQLLHKYSNQINWQGMNHEVFSSFYRFVYFICREPGKRNVQVGTAVAAWRLVLCGRFRLLDRWCTFVSYHHKASVIPEDTWRQVLDFSRTVREDLSNYDPASAWPVLLDEFVEYMKGRGQHRPQPLFVEPLDFSTAWSMRSIAAVSPRSGSKRRPPDVLEVADQLQQLPLVEGALQAQSAASSAHAAQSNHRAILTAKRARLTGQQLHQSLSGGGSSSSSSAADVTGMAGDQQGHAAGAANGAWGSTAGGIGNQPGGAASPVANGAPDANAMRVGMNRRSGGNTGVAGAGLCAFGQPTQIYHNQRQQQRHQHQLGAVRPPATVNAVQQQQQQLKMFAPHGPHSVAVLTGLALRESGLAGGVMTGCGQQQQQPDMGSASLAGNTCSSMDVSMSSPSQQQGRAQQQQQHSVGIYMPGQHGLSQLPPCPSPGYVHPQQQQQQHIRSEADLRRTNSVIAMMQVTVTEALGLH